MGLFRRVSKQMGSWYTFVQNQMIADESMAPTYILLASQHRRSGVRDTITMGI